jgi:uncharacterized protein with HEPN domain
MRQADPDAASVWDMVQAAREIAQFVAGRQVADLEADRMLRLAIERDLEIIGEAAARVSQEFRDAHPEIPLRRIVGLRNVIAHEYGDIMVDQLW